MKLFNDGLIRERLHLGGFHSEWDLCSSSVEARYKSDERASYWIYPLLIKAGLRVWVYSGDVDANVPITGTISWVMKLR
jgi:serine carboxypeptidase-like clade 2